MNQGNTPVDLQEAIIDELNAIFEGFTLPDEHGRQKPLSIYAQDLPIPEENDDEAVVGNVPYIVVRISQGEVPEPNEPEKTDIVIIICTYDEENDRQAYREIMHIINRTKQRFMTNPIIGNFRFKGPFQWALQDNTETFPVYFGAAELTFEAATAFFIEDEYI